MKASSDMRDIKLLCRPIRRVKLLVSRNKLTITVRGKENEFSKYIDAIIEAFDVDPRITNIADIGANDLLPPDAPLGELATVLSGLIASLSKRKGYRVEKELHHKLIPRERGECDDK